MSTQTAMSNQALPSSVESDSNDELAKKLAEMSTKTVKLDISAKDILDSAISRLVAFYPIYGTVFMFLNKVQDYGCPTMGVGIIRRTDLALFYNPDFVKKLTSKELSAVLTHESLHVLLHHIARASVFSYNPRLFNIAADAAINCYIAGLPDNCIYPKNFGLPDFESSEFYYEKLKQEAEKNSEGLDGAMAGKGEMVDSHDGWGECEDDVVKEKIRGIADKAVKSQDQKGWSAIGSDIAKAILEANKPVINWKRELRYFINKLILSGKKVTRSRINRREQATKKNRDGILSDVYIQPGSRKDYTSRLLVAIDTSGSVSDDELKEFIGEINGMIAHVKCDVIQFDTSIHGEPTPISKKITRFQFRGRGGTDFTPAIQMADEKRYDGIIMLTDGYAPFPKKPKARVLWALSKQGASVNPPYGKKVVIDIKKR